MSPRHVYKDGHNDMIGKREISYSAVDSYRKYIQRTTIYSESNHGLKE